jgi:hypothetical protein
LKSVLVAQNCGISGPILASATPSGLSTSAWRSSAPRPQFYHHYLWPHGSSATTAAPTMRPNVSKSVARFDRWLSNSRSGHNLIARSRIRTDSENSEIGNGIEIEFSNQFRLNPGDANMSFQFDSPRLRRRHHRTVGFPPGGQQGRNPQSGGLGWAVASATLC